MSKKKKQKKKKRNEEFWVADNYGDRSSLYNHIKLICNYSKHDQLMRVAIKIVTQ